MSRKKRSFPIVWRDRDGTESSFYLCEPSLIDSLSEPWERLLDKQQGATASLQSPEWVRWLIRNGPPPGGDVVLNVVRDPSGAIVGLTPLSLGRHHLDYQVDVFNPWRPLMAVDVLGSVPLIPTGPARIDTFFQSLFSSFPDVQLVSMRALPTQSEDATQLNALNCAGRAGTLYTPGGEFRTHNIQLPESMEAYLAGFAAKRRHLFARNKRKMEEALGAVTVRCFCTAEESQEFLEISQGIVERSWQSGTQWLLRNDEAGRTLALAMAERGHFRSYVLFAGERPCAYVYGYQVRAVYHYDQPGYDQALKQYSPGSLLLLALVEDLIASSSATSLSFGYGDSPYKEFFGNQHDATVTAMVFRRTLLNHLRVLIHSFWLRRGKPAALLCRDWLTQRFRATPVLEGNS